MKLFLKRVVFFVVTPVALLLIGCIILPARMFVYRPWEALKFATVPSYASFYPDRELELEAVGDLCHHTAYSIKRKEYWKTDEQGFRNSQFFREADLFIVGDSFIAGTGMTQDNTVSSQIMKIDTSLKTYNMAPSSMSEFDRLLKLGIIKKPKVLIFSKVERELPVEMEKYDPHRLKTRVLDKMPLSVSAYIDRIVKMYPLKWTKARLLGEKGLGVKGTEESKMFFLQGATQKHEAKDLVNTAAAILSYKLYCDSLGIRFIFLPMPDKETVYYENVPLPHQADYLFRLDSLLKKDGVQTINTLKLYNDYRKTNTELLYHLDDTHWNPTGTHLVAQEIVNTLRSGR